LPRPKIDLIYIDAGGGHRAAVTALEAVIREQRRPWETRPRNIQNLLYSIDVVRKLTGIPFQEVYNIMLRRGWTLGTAQLIPTMHLAIRIFHDAQVRALAGHWSQDPPDMVVSLIPHYNRAIKQALAQVCPAAALVTILYSLPAWSDGTRQASKNRTPRTKQKQRRKPTKTGSGNGITAFESGSRLGAGPSPALVQARPQLRRTSDPAARVVPWPFPWRPHAAQPAQPEDPDRRRRARTARAP
jgi:hypothetical protein